MISKWEDILSKYDLFLMFVVGQILKIGFTKQSFLHKNLVSAEFTNKEHGKPTLHSLIANHVLEMSVKLTFQCACFEKKHCFALVVFSWIKTRSHDAAYII